MYDVGSEETDISDAIRTRGHLRFMAVKGSVRSEKTCEFLDRLMHNTENQIFLI